MAKSIRLLTKPYLVNLTVPNDKIPPSILSWEEELNAVNELAKKVFGETDLMSLNELKVYQQVQPSAWWICKSVNPGQNETVTGYAHVEVITEPIAQAILLGQANEFDIVSEAECERRLLAKMSNPAFKDFVVKGGFVRNGGEEVLRSDYIHIGSYVAHRPFTHETHARLLAGVTEVVLAYNNRGKGPQWVIAVSYPEPGPNKIEHALQELKKYKFQNEADIPYCNRRGETTTKFADSEGRAVYRFNLDLLSLPDEYCDVAALAKEVERLNNPDSESISFEILPDKYTIISRLDPCRKHCNAISTREYELLKYLHDNRLSDGDTNDTICRKAFSGGPITSNNLKQIKLCLVQKLIVSYRSVGFGGSECIYKRSIGQEKTYVLDLRPTVQGE